MPTPAEHRIIAGDTAILARRYAGALYELAADQKQLDTVTADLRMLRILARESAEFRSIAFNPRLSRTQLMKAMQEIAKSAKFGALTANFLMLAAQNRRLDAMEAMADAFLAELAQKRGEFSAEIRTAYALTPAQQEQLAVQLRALAGGKVHMTVTEDKSLLGGLTVKLGSKLIDASVKSKLARLERRLKSQSPTPLEGAA